MRPLVAPANSWKAITGKNSGLTAAQFSSGSRFKVTSTSQLSRFTEGRGDIQTEPGRQACVAVTGTEAWFPRSASLVSSHPGFGKRELNDWLFKTRLFGFLWDPARRLGEGSDGLTDRERLSPGGSTCSLPDPTASHVPLPLATFQLRVAT